jgi:pimeloyl-ACP methyl ester carboxylesterase
LTFITTGDGTRIAYEVFGSGYPLLLIPGLGASSRVWGAFPKAMGAHFRVIAFDPRGFGASEAPPSTISLTTLVTDIADLLTGLGVEKAHLFGVSMGGILAQRFASESPGRVGRLVLVSTTGRMSRWSRRMLDMFEIMARRLSPRDYVTVMGALSLSPAFFEAEKGRVADMENVLVPKESEMGAIRAQVEAIRSLGADSASAPIRTPTLVVSGRRDFLTPPAQARELHRSIPGAERLDLEGGHACLLENTEEGLVRILAFLRTPR